MLNPNGISFGPNARLNIGGSFLASTATSLNFADGTVLSTTNSPTTQPLLTVSVPIGLQFGGSAANIQVRGARLQVPQTLGLVGGNVTLVGARLTAAGGRISLGSVAGVTPDTAPVKVSLTPIAKGWALGYEGIQNFQDIQSQQAILNASGSGGGDIQVQGRRVMLTGGSQMVANTQGSAPGGTLAVIASESVELSDRSALLARVEAGATGAGGNLTIETGRLLVRDGAQILTSTSGQGQAGNLTVQNATEVELVGSTIAADGRFISSGLFTQTTAKATGAGGNLSISAGKLIVRDGAQVNSTTSGVGRAGDLTVRATDVELIGDALSADGKLLTDVTTGLPFPSGLFAGTDIGSEGDGGTLIVKTDRLSLRNGAVLQTSTLGAGDSGSLIVQATDAVEVIGKAADGRFPSSLLAVSGGIPGFPGVFEAKGRGGNLTITTKELIVRDGAAVAVSSLNSANDALGAGNLQIQAQNIRLDNQGRLTAATASGQGGDIELSVPNLLLLRRNSEISASAGIAGAGGNGGNIIIDSPFIVAVPEENSDITANAFIGNGGRVEITAEAVIGLEIRKQLTQLSDITAFSQQNPKLNGLVEINTPDIDPSHQLVALSAELVDASKLIAQGCETPGGIRQGELSITGRGGLPPTPTDTLSSDTVWSDLRYRTQLAETQTSSDTRQTLTTAPQLVEATGWVINNKGEVVLTASTRTVTPHSAWQAPASCPTP